MKTEPFRQVPSVTKDLTTVSTLHCLPMSYQSRMRHVGAMVADTKGLISDVRGEVDTELGVGCRDVALFDEHLSLS